MPELPEVQTIRTQLNAVMPLRITSFKTSDVSDSIIHTKLEKLKGKVILQVGRKGKMLDFLLDDGRHLLSHLGMTGSWRIGKERSKVKHTHLELEGECVGANAAKQRVHLYYVDPRRFGHMYLYSEKDAKKKLDELGVDLKSDEFTLSYFKEALMKYPERAIKVTLLDQKLFAGTGNYIANEICARGGVLPTRLVKELSNNEIKKLYQAVAIVIDGATETGGTTFQGGYADTTGSKGGGVTHLVVFYQKICQMCKKTAVIKITLGQRGTYYCSKCQK